MAERMVRLRAKIAHCAGGAGNFEVGQEYTVPESIARGRIYNGLAEEVAANAASSEEGKPQSRDPASPAKAEQPARNQETPGPAPRSRG